MPYLVGYATPYDYGAAGNGTTDDTSAVQAAINAVSSAGGGVVYFPAGTFKLTAALSVPNLVSLLGAGPGASVLNQTSTTANAITYNPTTLNYISVANLTISGPGSGSGIGLLVEANGGANPVTSCSFQDLTISGFGSHGIEIVGGVGCSAATVNVSSVGGHAFYISGGTGLSLTGCYANGSTSTQQGFNLTNASHATLTGCRAYKTGGGYLLSGGSTNAIVGCGADTITAQNGQDGSGFKISGGVGHSLTTCYSNINNAVAYYITSNAVAALIEGVQETAPGGSATASIKCDSGSTTAIVDYSVVTATSLAANTSTVLAVGSLTLPNGASLTKNLQVGGTAGLGDNGVGEIQLTNATTVPTTNPTGGGLIYAVGGMPYHRDTSGNLYGLASSSGATRPGIQSLIAWNYDPEIASSTFTHASGTVYLHQLYIPVAATITNILIGVTTAGSGLTSGQNLVGLYNASGTRVAVSVDQTTAWGTTGSKTCALTGTYSAAAGTYWVGVLSVGTTPITVAASPGFRAAYEAGVAGATLRHGANATGQTSMPASVTLSSNASTGDSMWVGLN